MTAGIPQTSLDPFLQSLLGNADMLRMGHAQEAASANLGFGWLYYALARIVRPRRAVVIGSFRGFVPLVIARALLDQRQDGRVQFIDPSLVDSFWRTPSAVQAHFASFGIDNIDHACMTTQEFVATPQYRDLGATELVFVDGYHTAEQARFDFEAFAPRVSACGVILLHDSIREKTSTIYGADRPYRHTVVHFVDELKRDAQWQVFDLPFASGLTLVRRAQDPVAAA